MKHATRPAIFKWRQTAPELLLCAVRWYLLYSLSLRDVEELLRRARSGGGITRPSGVGCNVTVPHWNSGCVVISSRSTNLGESTRHIFDSRAVGPSISPGATINFLLSALRDAAAAKRLFRRALGDPSHPQPRVINIDKARLYGSAIAAVKEEGTPAPPPSTGPILE